MTPFVEKFALEVATTLAVGDVPASVRALLATTRESLERGIDACRPGGRLSDVSHAVQTHVQRRGLATRAPSRQPKDLWRS